jgi:hypothetical protein
MPVIVVKPSAVWQDSVGADVVVFAPGFANVELRVFGVYGEAIETKSSKIGTRAFVSVIPTDKDLVRVRTNEVFGILDLIFGSPSFDEETVFRFDAGENVSQHLVSYAVAIVDRRRT